MRYLIKSTDEPTEFKTSKTCGVQLGCMEKAKNVCTFSLGDRGNQLVA